MSRTMCRFGSEKELVQKTADRRFKFLEASFNDPTTEV